MSALGAELLILSNASGGLHSYFSAGDLMVLDSHIDLMGSRMASARVSQPRPSGPYDPQLIERAAGIARGHDILLHRGVYVGVVGPNYETRAEYRALRRIGGDAVGMSTVPEVHAAAGCGLKTVAIATITNVAVPDAPLANDGHDVVDTAAAAEPKLRRIVLDLIKE